ncbi:MAG: hypothetical protein LBT09_00710 [Planctomycetaceae bacterium]|jgi:hypothetical protein|nr:hypothetical protein [Planctomycetaceae bacterium]
MLNEQYNKNSTLNEPYESENYSGQMMFKNGFMDNFCSGETEQNMNNKPEHENNIPQGIIIAHMPDLGDCKPIPNGTSGKTSCYPNDGSIQQHGLFGVLGNFVAGIFGLTTNHSANNCTHRPDILPAFSLQPARLNIQFSRLIIVGIIVLFCGAGLVVQNQINKNTNVPNTADPIIVTNNPNTAANAGNIVENKSGKNGNLPDTLKNPTLGNTASVNPANVKNVNPPQNNQPDKTLTAQNKQNSNKPDPQNQNHTTKSVAGKTAKPNQNTTKNSVWDRPPTDNYLPWIKDGQISLGNKPESESEKNPNANTRTTENQNKITQTSASQIQPHGISTPYPSGTTYVNTSQSRSYYYGTNNNYTNANSYGNPTTERAAPPPYANSMSIQMSSPFHLPPATSPSGSQQGRIVAAETPATYRNFYGNRNDLRTASTAAQPPAYTYTNQPNYPTQPIYPTNYPPTQPAGAVVPVQPPLTAAAYPATSYPPATYPPTSYPNSTYRQPTTSYPPTTTYANPNMMYQNTAYPNGTYPNGTYPNGTYPNGTYPNGTYPNPAIPHANSRTITNPHY